MMIRTMEKAMEVQANRVARKKTGWSKAVIRFLTRINDGIASEIYRDKIELPHISPRDKVAVRLAKLKAEQDRKARLRAELLGKGMPTEVVNSLVGTV